MYKQIYKPDHHRATVLGFVSEHVLLAEESLGRLLVKGELVHHKDFVKLNNDLSNLLFPITRSDHQRLPEFQAQFIISLGLYEQFLEYWYSHKNSINEELELQKQLVKAEYTQKRLRLKIQRQERK